MKRENRYMVLKNADIERYLSESDIAKLCEIDSMINFRRQQDDKGLLNAVVIESDWPEYESTWKAIEQRVDNNG